MRLWILRKPWKIRTALRLRKAALTARVVAGQLRLKTERRPKVMGSEDGNRVAGIIATGNAATVTANTARALTVKAAEKVPAKAAGTITDAGNAGKELTESRARTGGKMKMAAAGNAVTVTAVNAMRTAAVTALGNGAGTNAVIMKTLKTAARKQTASAVPAGIVITAI